MMTQQNNEQIIITVKHPSYRQKRLLEEQQFEYDSERKQYSAYVLATEAEEIIRQIVGLSMNGFTRIQKLSQKEWEAQAIPFKEREPEVSAWLEAYNGDNSFYLSLKSYFEKHGRLTDGQLRCIRNDIVSETSRVIEQVSTAESIAPAAPIFVPTYKDGTVLEVRGRIAKRIAASMEYNVPHRNLEIIKTIKETRGGILALVRYSPKFGTRCMKCGAKLDCPISRATGVGPICSKHYGIPRKSLLETEVVLHLMESTLPKKEVQMWIPRDQINGSIAIE